MIFLKDFSFWPYLDMGVAPTVAMGRLADGSISNFACNISNYLCTNFGAFIKKCTIDQLSRSTSTNFLVYLLKDLIFIFIETELWYYILSHNLLRLESVFFSTLEYTYKGSWK